MRILFLAGDELWFRHLPVAHAAKEAGADVILMAPFQRYGGHAESQGYRIIPWHLSRRSLNPFRESRSLSEVIQVYQRERPDLVHHIALKAVIYGGAAARLSKTNSVVATITGLGRVFTIQTRKMRLFRAGVCRAIHTALDHENCITTFENEDDLELFAEQRIVRRETTRFIPGMGIDTNRFSPTEESSDIPIVLLPSRMLWEKGIGLFVEAAAQLKAQGLAARFVLVGSPDLESRRYIPESQLRAWAETRVVEWWGSNGDMPSTLAKAHVVCLPTSYREGVPRVLMEASACARAVVTTDVPGCRYVVRHEENGLLVPPQDASSLAAALAKLLNNDELRKRMAAAGRSRAIREFSEPEIVRQMFDVYGGLLGAKWLPSEFAIPHERVTAADQGIAAVAK